MIDGNAAAFFEDTLHVNDGFEPARTHQGEAICLFAEDPGAIDDVTLRNVTAEFRAGRLFAAWGDNLDLRPAANRRLAIRAGATRQSGRGTSAF